MQIVIYLVHLCVLRHAFDVAIVETIQRSNNLCEKKIAGWKWNHLRHCRENRMITLDPIYRRSKPEGIKRVYGLNIEGRARDLTSHNLILLIMSYPINGARESMYTRDEFAARARFTWEYEICILDSVPLSLHD